jgi:2-polyprenyl-3-methyl-5-hydroxy-6-metoxy-1,4-benzoquinol methylase
MILTPDLSRRVVRDELMDDPSLAAPAHERALRGLGRINRTSGTARMMFRQISNQFRRRTPSSAPTDLRLLDVASGGGDVTIDLHRRARRAGWRWQVDGCDCSATAVRFAQRRASGAGAAVNFFQLDVFSAPLPKDYDVVVCSLFLHHNTQDRALRLLASMAAAARSLVVVHDLERRAPGWWAAWAGVRVLSRSPVVHVDGPRSVEGAFTCAEVAELASKAGLKGALVTRSFPMRFVLTWSKP